MKKAFIVVLFALMIGVTACGPVALPTPGPTLPPTPTHTPGPVGVSTTSTPDASASAQAYLDAWRSENYLYMYSLLTAISRDAINEEDFTQRYTQVASTAALSVPLDENGLPVTGGSFVDYQITSAYTTPSSAQVGYRVTLHSYLVGDISADTVMSLSLENGEWRVQWDDTLILPQLAGGNLLRIDPQVPSRANIYDRAGQALVAQSEAVSIGLDTSLVNLNQMGTILDVFSTMTGNRINREVLKREIENYRLYGGWYLPVIDVSAEVYGQFESRLNAIEGIWTAGFQARYYFDNNGTTTAAAHVTGFRSAIQPNEVEYFARLGYQWNEMVGRQGLEKWGERYLAGTRGGSLYVVAPDGTVVTRLAERSAQPAQAIYTTIDRDLQLAVQQALGRFPGAIVVMEVETGRVLALASNPGYNPNAFEPSNWNSGSTVVNYYAEGSNQPLFNRATQGQYPLGSVFKIITLAAALESGLWNTESTYNCGYFFEEIQGWTPNDWTYDRYLRDGRTGPSGLLTLPQGLMRSCNPWFWHIGLGFYNRGMYTAISDMARGFGLGELTGIELGPGEELAGQNPVPSSEVDAANLAIGQGNSQVTPLQVARFIAALGNGGTLHQPHLIERIAGPVGEPTYVFTPTVIRQLPLSEENLQIIHDAMVSVVENTRGTAHHRFLNLSVNIAGKTGTAESGYGEPHAWFAGYTFQNNPNRPDIAVVVFVENRGEGSEYGAPIFRRVIESYFLGRPYTMYPWEAQIGVEKSPTPAVTDTPVAPTETPTPTPEGEGEETPTPEG